ncbi:phage tail protein [Pectobacterium parmentieri]|uniref:phage tail protein n=1 Tax=Pectobacterium parmentieri TaxID=1905730 RepID=UPI000D61F99C|nr:phage tail protein [Pectobacterium parmentieri]PWD58529.1 phage tail protein [Pectobacterium parmentieri]
MADDKLKTPVHVRAVSIKAVSLPVGFSPAYQQYVLSQALDFTNVAGKANQAAGGAYDAQVRNDEQDVILEDHEQRLDAAEATLADHEGRITANTNAISLLTVRVTTAEGQIVTLQSDVNFLIDEVVDVQADITALDGRVSNAESDIDAIQADYVSKSETASQSISSPINVTMSYSVNGTKVVGQRQTGWTAATGTAYRGAFNADTSWTIGMLNVLQIQQISDALTQARQRIKALEDDLRAHGLIN